MNDLIKFFDHTISKNNNQINDHTKGTNYLEKIKYILLEAFKEINNFSFYNFDNSQEMNLIKNYGQNKLSLKITKISESISKIKNLEEFDHLTIILCGTASFRIFSFSNSNESKIINLYPNTGIVVSKNTQISTSVGKETILFDIFLNNENVDIEK